MKTGLTRDGRYRLTPWSRIKYGPLATRFWNWRGQKARERGRRDIAARIGDQVRSRTPVVRSQINRGTGRPHRDDRHMGRLSDQSLARFRQRLPATRTQGRSR